MKKPNFRDTFGLNRHVLAQSLGREVGETFTAYKLRRAVMNQAVKSINAQAPARVFMRHTGIKKSEGARTKRIGKGKHVFADSLQRHFDDLNYQAWKLRQEMRKARKFRLMLRSTT